MKGINTVVIGGNLARDAELKEFPNGGAVLNATVCVNTSKKVGDAWEDEPNFFDVTVTGEKRARAIASKLTKGTHVVVQGTLRQRSWEQDGKKRSKVEVRADEVHIDRKGAQQDQQQDQQQDMFSYDIPF